MASEATSEKRVEMPQIPALETRVNLMAHVAVPGYLAWRERKAKEAGKAPAPA